MSSGKINDLSEFIKIVKVPFPIRTDGKYVYTVFLYIVDFLTYIVLNDNLISKPRGLYGFDSFQNIVADIEFSSS